MPQTFVSLMYHNVIRGDTPGARGDGDALGRSITSYFVGEAEFARQLDAIVSRARVMTYGELEQFYFGPCGGSLFGHNPAVQLTFDDGWRGVFDVAGPLLAARGLQALVFVTTGLIGAPHFLTADALARVPAETFRIGSHTVSHRFLNELADRDIRRELRESRQTLEDLLGYAVDAVSIPNGAVDERVISIAEECGYRFVCTSRVHRNDRARGPQAIGRVPIRATTSIREIRRYTAGDLRRERLRSWMLSVPKRLIGPEHYRNLRRRLLGHSRADSEMSDLFRVSNCPGRNAGQGQPAAAASRSGCASPAGGVPCAGG